MRCLYCVTNCAARDTLQYRVAVVVCGRRPVTAGLSASPDCKSCRLQVLTVSSLLPLISSVPSGLNATASTLCVPQSRTRSNTCSEEENLLQNNAPVGVPSQCPPGLEHLGTQVRQAFIVRQALPTATPVAPAGGQHRQSHLRTAVTPH